MIREKIMRFEVVSSVNDCKNKDTIYLILDNWDDWFTYSTLFKVRYIDENGTKGTGEKSASARKI